MPNVVSLAHLLVTQAWTGTLARWAKHFSPSYNDELKIRWSQSNRASPAGHDMSRSLPGKAVVNLSDHLRVAKSQTFHLRRAGDAGL